MTRECLPVALGGIVHIVSPVTAARLQNPPVLNAAGFLSLNAGAGDVASQVMVADQDSEQMLLEPNPILSPQRREQFGAVSGSDNDFGILNMDSFETGFHSTLDRSGPGVPLDSSNSSSNLLPMALLYRIWMLRFIWMTKQPV